MLPKHVFLCTPGEDASDEACRDAALHVDCNLAEAEDDNRKHRIPGKEIELTIKTCHKNHFCNICTGSNATRARHIILT